MGFLKVPEPNLPPDELKKLREENDMLYNKIKEYQNKFGECFTTINLPMTTEEIIENIDKCIKNNRKWEGYIVPELDYDDVDI